MEKKNENNNMLTAEQIAALFDSQSDRASEEQPVVAEEQTAVIEEELSAIEEPIAAEPEPKRETEVGTSGMLTAEQIAALFDSQSDTASEEQPSIIEEPIAAEPEPKTEPEAGTNGMLTAEQIAALFDSQSDTASGEQTAVAEEQTSVIEEPIAVAVEPKREPEVGTNGMLTAEQIAALFDSQDDTASKEQPPVVEEEPSIIEEPIAAEPEPKREPEAGTNGMLTAEQIAELFDSQSDTASGEQTAVEEEQPTVIEEEPSVIEEPIVAEPEPKREPEAGTNGMLTAEQIAALFDSQDDTASEEQTAVVEEEPSAIEEPIAAVVEPKRETEVGTNGMLTAEQIAALFDSQSDTASGEQPVVVEEQPAVVEEPIVAEPEPKREPEVGTNGMLTAEQIAALFDSQDDTVSEEQPAVAEEEPSAIEEPIVAEPEPKREPEAGTNGMLTAEQIAELFDSQDDTASKEQPAIAEEQPAVIEEELSAIEEPIAAEPEPKRETEVGTSGMLTAEQIAALFDSQSDTASKEQPAVAEEQPAVIEEEHSVIEEPIVAEPEPKREPEAGTNGMLTAEQIAALFDSQSDTASEEQPVVAEEQPPVVEEEPSIIEEPIVAEPEPKREPEAGTNGMLTAEQIAALFDSQSDTASEEQPVVAEEQPAVVEEEPSAIEEPIAAAPEPKREPEAGTNGMLTAEQIAALFDSQSDTASGEQTAVVEEEPSVIEEPITAEPEPKRESEAGTNGMLTAEQIAALFDSQSDTASGEQPVVVEEQPAVIEEELSAIEEPIVAEPEPTRETEVGTNGMLTAEQIAELFDSQSDTVSGEQTAVVEEQTSVIEEPIAVAVEPKRETEVGTNGMLTAEQIAALFDSQSDMASEEQPAVAEEEPSVIEEPITAEPEPKREPESGTNGMLTAEQIAALFDSQSDTDSGEQPAVAEEQPAVVEEEPSAIEEPIAAEPEPKTEPESGTNGMLTAEQIAALFDSQDDTASGEQTAVVEEEPSVIEEPITAEPEPKRESEAGTNGMLTAEQIAALFDSQSDTASGEQPVVVEEQPAVAEEQPSAIEEPIAAAPEPTRETEVGTNGMLTAEQIAALFDSQDDTASKEQPPVVEEEPSVIEEPITAEPEPKREPEAGTNGMLTAEQIAALFDSQSDTVSEEQPAVAEEQTSVIEEPIAVAVEPKTEPESGTNGMLTAEQIAELFDSQSDTVSEEQPVVVEEQTSVIEEPIAVEPELKNEPEAGTNGTLTAEEIATLFGSQSDTASEEQPAVAEEQTSVIEEPIAVEPELKNEPEAGTNGTLTAEEIATLFGSQDDTASEEQPAVAEEQPTVIEEPIAAEPEPKTEPESGTNDMLTAEQSTEFDSGKSPSKEKSSIISRFNISFKNILSNLNRLKIAKKESSKDSLEQISMESKLQSTQEVTQVDITENPDDLMRLPVNEPLDEVEQNESVLDEPEKSTKGKKAAKPPKIKKQKIKTQKSGLKVASVVVGVALLVTGSFAAGYFSRDYISLFKPDPVKAAAQAEEKAKLAEQQAEEAKNAKRAEELAAIDPKEYTSSMYLESLILKGQAGSKTSIKLDKIDDVSLLTQFPKLRRIRLYNMTGNEDLSVIQKLSGVEEILVENSVLKNQFGKGIFNSVTYLEMTDCKVENSNQFANFKKLNEFYAENTKFITTDGKLNITSYTPTIETLVLNNCGEYDELVNIQNLKQLKKLKLSDSTIVKSMSYVQNPHIETVTVDISFVKNAEQLTAFSSLQNLSSLTVEAGNTPLSTTELSDVLDRVATQHPKAIIKISTY